MTRPSIATIRRSTLCGWLSLETIVSSKSVDVTEFVKVKGIVDFRPRTFGFSRNGARTIAQSRPLKQEAQKRFNCSFRRTFP